MGGSEDQWKKVGKHNLQEDYHINGYMFFGEKQGGVAVTGPECIKTYLTSWMEGYFMKEARKSQKLGSFTEIKRPSSPGGGRGNGVSGREGKDHESGKAFCSA